MSALERWDYEFSTVQIHGNAPPTSVECSQTPIRGDDASQSSVAEYRSASPSRALLAARQSFGPGEGRAAEAFRPVRTRRRRVATHQKAVAGIGRQAGYPRR